MNDRHTENDSTFDHRLWQSALLFFVIAGLTGVLFRVGMLTVLPFDLSLENVRHAHSHLMFFGWASLLPLYLIYKEIGRNGETGSSLRVMRRALWGIVVFSLLSFPFFLIYGYHPVPVGDGSIPASVIMSGGVMLCWYLFIGGTLSVKNKRPGGGISKWFGGSLLMLFIASLGAWGVAVIQFAGVENPLFGKALTHFFLACFTEGWIVLVTLAIIIRKLEVSGGSFPVSPSLIIVLVMVGAPLTFPYGIAESMFTAEMNWAARVGGLMAGTGLMLGCYGILRSNRGLIRTIWLWPLIFLALKAVLQLLSSVIPSEFWLSDHALRVFYLHLLLLGALSLSLIGCLHVRFRVRQSYFNGVAFSVSIVMVSLLLLTRFWPVGWSGIWQYYVVAGAALLPVIAVTAEWIKLVRSWNRL